MKVLVVGGGGREHAIVMKLSESPLVTELYCAPGNGGIAKYATCCPVKATDLEGMLALAKKLEADWVFVAPDDPLVMGMADLLRENGFKVFGPSKAAAIIEGSKAFSKNLMKKYGIPTAKYEVFDSAEKAIAYVQEQNTYPTVVKADGLALGKGVIIAMNEEEATAAIRSIMEDKIFGESGSRLVVEEFLTGPEVSVLAFTDGETIVPMISSMDHKRALDGDRGKNTGGMGTVSPNPYYTKSIAEQCMREIFLPTMHAMNGENRTFRGCLYFGLMLTPEGPKVIEYNCRFGDPETQVVLPMLKTDLLEIMEAVEEQRLADLSVHWKSGACACVILASGGYPGKYETGKVIGGLNEKGQVEGAAVYHAGTKLENGEFLTAGGRVLGVTAAAENLKAALSAAYAAAEKIRFENMHFRKDIGQRALAAEK
ncbi:MAG: phosphoribosylamine--glycine ligase [Oscillospiraceae bacterium]|nr:phosphoribosylamine--glycine ligase [Oscillospiraceae bacterium]